jgi:leader peptidase (prepilin peptidase)/N-methyltransferase
VTIFSLPYWLAVAFLFVLGAIAGSFLNVCIHRIPQQERLWPALKGLWSPPSRCPRCRTHIAWHDNVPILGWLLLRGRCRTCKMWIPVRYPLVELLNALLFVALYCAEVPYGWPPALSSSSLFDPQLGPQVVPGLGPLSPLAFLHLRYFYHLVLVESLIVASLIDIDRREIPDASTLPAMAVGILGGLLIGRVHILPAWTQNSAMVFGFTRLIWPNWNIADWPVVPAWFAVHPHLHGLLVSLAGLVVGGGVTWLVRIIGFRVLRREAMGFGDVVLMAVIGSFVGWQPALMAFFIAPACALLFLPIQYFIHRDRYIPYGPFLSLGTLIVLLAWGPLWTGVTIAGVGRFGGARSVFALGILLIVFAAIMAVLFVGTLYLVQGVKRLFGWDAWPEEFVAEWTAADQAQYIAGERVDRHVGRWRKCDWPGEASSRGSLFEDRWRRGQGCPAHTVEWLQRSGSRRTPQ